MNNATSKLFINSVLAIPQQQTWPNLAVFASNFYLAGGTGLALQLNHRKSVDFDLFTQEKIDPIWRRKVINVFGESTRFTMDSTEQLTWFTANGVKITLAYTPHAPLYSLLKTDSIPLETIADIAANKAFVVGRRGEYRDYVDLAFVLQAHHPLETIVRDAKKKYGAMFEEKLFLEQLTYFDDLSNTIVELVESHHTPTTIKEKLQTAAQQYIKEHGADFITHP